MEEVLPCCGSRSWAERLAERRPLPDEAELMRASDAIWRGLAEADWREAFASHPCIGERHAPGEATAQSLAWSSREQSAVGLDDGDTARRLVEGNRAYEARFGRSFLVCASGKSGAEIVAILNSRLNNDPETERRESAEQQRQITRLRLGRWMRAE